MTRHTPSGGAADVVPVFEARGLTKTYRMGEVEVHPLRGFDFDLYAGEFVVMLGPSDSGKSTLLNILGGLDVPSAGQVRYLGHDLTTADDAALTVFEALVRAGADPRRPAYAIAG